MSTGRRRVVKIVMLAAAAVVVMGGLVASAGFVLLHVFNPVADEWVCSDGQAPATFHGGGGDCFPEGSTLPAGYTWDPFGNRPMPYNCDKSGWQHIERTVRHRGTVDEQDCVRDGTTLPSGWHVAPID